MALVGSFYLASCGDDAGQAVDLNGLSKIPSGSALLEGSGANGIHKNFFLVSDAVKAGINLQSVSGTAPNLKDLTSTNASTYFWNGLVADINANWGGWNATQKDSARNKFWGQDTTTPGPGGHGACMMAQSVGEALSRMLSGTGTLCYMKGIETVENGITVSSGAKTDVFKQGTADKIVKVAVTNMVHDRSGSRTNMDVFFTVKGSDSVGNHYAYNMYMCNSGSVTSVETFDVNRDDGKLTATSSDANDGNRGQNTVVAYLEKSGDGFTFSKSKDRTASSQYTGSWGTYKGDVTISAGDLIRGKRYNSNSWGTDKNFSLAAFSGTGVDTFKFLQACYRGISTMSGQSAHTYQGVTEYRNTYYASVASSDLSPTCDNYNFTTDSFFTSISVPSLDTTGKDCGVTPDITVTMDFSASAVAALQTSCDEGNRKLSNYDMCQSSAVQTAMNSLWN